MKYVIEQRVKEIWQQTHTSEKLPKDLYAILLSPHNVLIGKAVWFWLSYLFIPPAPFHFSDGRKSVFDGEYLNSYQLQKAMSIIKQIQ